MIGFFPEVYPDETIYSIFSRYHKRTGKTNRDATMVALVGLHTMPSFYAPSNLEYLSSQFPSGHAYSPEYFIENHSILKFFKLFIPKKRWNDLVIRMKSQSSGTLKGFSGLIVGSKVNKLRGLRICPQCVRDDIENYGEAYFHRGHQLPGNYLCHKHYIWLCETPMSAGTSKGDFIYPEDPMFVETPVRENCFIADFYKLTKNIKYLMDAKLDRFSLEIVSKKYVAMLNKKRLLDLSGKVDYDGLHTMFKNHYRNDFLEKVDCGDVGNWINDDFIKAFYAVNPVKHLLFIDFLFGSIEAFFNSEEDLIIIAKDKINRPFGKGPFPCLNPAADHYGEKRILDYRLISCKETTGVFKCDCGFSYSRKGTDMSGERMFEISKIVRHGDLWDKKLREYALDGKYKLVDIANMMRTNPGNISKCVKRIRNNPNTDFHNGFSEIEKSAIKRSKEIKKREKANKYKNDILEYISNNPGINRKQLKKVLNKQYTFWWRYDRNALLEFIPSVVTMEGTRRDLVCWPERDEEYFNKVIIAIKIIRDTSPPMKVTFKEIERQVNQSLRLMLKKMPKTKGLIEKNIESIEGYTYRRISYVIDQLMKEGVKLNKAFVCQKSGVPNTRNKFSDYIAELLAKMT